MSLKTVPFSSLLPPKAIPRRTLDTSQIAALAQTIRIDGVLQNLVVRPEKDKYRVLTGKRRYLALQLLKKEKHIDGDYKVPVEVKKDISDGDALRLATVENVQREQLHPLDEAEAFSNLLQTGGTVDDIAAKTGLGTQTVKRRLALASLCPKAKQALHADAITLRVAEALTIGSAEQQRMILENVESGVALDAGDIRDSLLGGKPTLAMAIFSKERYTGSLTTDLFAAAETTYYDDVDQFLTLQKEAVEALAEEHRTTTAWVEVFNLYTVPWWQYRDAKKNERPRSGVVINLHPSGSVEVRDGLMKHEVKAEVVNETRETPIAPKLRERPTFSASLLRFVAYQKSVAVQAALLRNPRKAKEVAVLLLMAGGLFRYGIRLSPHACLKQLAAEGGECHAYRELDAASAALADRLGFPLSNGEQADANGIARLLAGDAIDVVVYERVAQLSDEELDRLLVLLPVLCFGQDDVEVLDTDQSLFNRIAEDLKVNLRDWWTPDVAFLSALRRDQLLAVARNCGAAVGLAGLDGWSKTELVQALGRFFATSAGAEIGNDEASRKARQWLPGILKFPATEDLSG